MPAPALNNAYEGYTRCAKKPHLTREEFAQFWDNISEEDREWWLQEFQTGRTALTRELVRTVSASQNADVSKLPPVVRSAIEAAVRMHEAAGP